MNFFLGMIAGVLALIFSVSVIANAQGKSLIKDCESMGQHRIGDTTLVCHIKKDTNDNP